MPRRTALLARTALGGLAMLGSAAQALPGAPVNIAVGTAGGAPVITNPNATTLDIDFNAARTVLQYNGFDVASGETVNLRFDSRSDIGVIHNVGQNAISIDGALNSLVSGAAGGNVWLLSSSGVFFGANARVDVGGLLASTAVPSNLLTAGFLDGTSLSFDFDTANSNGLINIAEGAQISGHGGSLAFIAPSVVSATGSTVSGGGDTSVLYGATERYVVRFVRQASDDLDLLDFEVPGLSAGSSANTTLDIGGTTNAGNVYLASVGKAQTIASVLYAYGNITATSAGVEGGSIVLTSGGGIANRIAAPLFTDGQLRQSVQVAAGMTASGDVTASATGNIDIYGDIAAGGSIVMTGLTIYTQNLTATQDIVLRAGDAIGSTGSGYGYGYGYGYYGPSGGYIGVADASAGDDVLATAWNGNVSFGSVVLAGIGPDVQGDPLKQLDATGDGRRLLLRTTGDFGDVYLGRGRESFRTSETLALPASLILQGGTDSRLEAVGGVQVFGEGDVTLTKVTAGSNADFNIDGSLDIGTVTATGYIFAQATGSVLLGDATASLDRFDNGQIILHGGTGARVTNATAATDLFVFADTGDAVAGTVTAGDDIFLRAFAGNTLLTSAKLGGGPDVDGNFANQGEGGRRFFETSPDENGNGNRIDLRTYQDNGEGGGEQLGLDVRLGLGTGSISGYTNVYLDAARDVTVDLAGAASIDAAYATRDVSIKTTGAVDVVSTFSEGNTSVVSTGGDASVGDGTSFGNLSVVAALGNASVGSVRVERDFLLDGATVSYGNISGVEGESPFNVTIRTRASDFFATNLAARNDLTLDIAGQVEVYGLTAGRDIIVTAAGDAVLGSPFEATIDAGRDFTVTAANVSLAQGISVNVQRDVTLTATALTGTVEADRLIAGDDLRITAATIKLDYGSASNFENDNDGDGSNIFLTGGAISAGYLFATDDIVSLGTGAGSYGSAACRFGCESSGAFANRDLSLTGSSLAFTGNLYAGRDLALNATAADLDVSEQSLSAGRDVRLTSAAALTAGSLDASQDIILDGGSVSANSVSARRNVLVTARTGNATISSANVKQDLSVTAALGLAAVGDARVGRDFVLSGRTATLGSLANYSETTGYGYGYGYGYGTTTFPIRDVTITTTAGDFAYAALLQGTRDVRVDIAGKLDLATVIAGNDLALRSTGALTLSGPGSAGRDAVIDGGSLDLAGLGAGRDLTVTARAGSLTASSTLLAGDDIRLSGATIAVGDLGIATAQEDTEADGRTITLDGGSATLASATAPGNIRATLSGALTTGPGSVTSSGGTVTVSAGSIAQSVPSATGLVFDGASGVSLTTTGAIDTGGLNAAGGTILANAGTTLRLRGTVIGPVAVLSGNNVTLDGLVQTSAGASVTARSGSVGGQQLESDGDVTVSSTGGISLASVRAGDDATLTAGGAVTVTGPVMAGSTANGLGIDSEDDGYNVRVTGAAVGLYSVNAPTDVVVTGDSVLIDAATSGDSVIAGRDATITARTGNAVIGDASVRRDLTVIAAAGLAQVGNARVGQDVRLTGSSVALGSLAAFTESGGYGYGTISTPTRDLIVVATAGGFTSSGPLALSRDASFDVSGALALSQLTAGRDITARAASLDIGTATAGDDIRLSGTTIKLGSGTTTGTSDSETDGSNIVATGGTVDARLLSAANDVLVTATGAVVLAASEGGIDAGRDIVVRGASLAAGRLTATRDLSLTVTAGDLTASAVQSAGRDLTLDASGAVTGGSLSAARDLSVIGASVDFGSLGATRDLTATARSGTLTLGSASAGDDARFSGPSVDIRFASTDASAADTEADGSNIVATGGDIAISTAHAFDDVSATALGTLTLGQGEGGISAGRDIFASGGTLDLGNLSAGRDLALIATASGIESASELSAVRDLRVDSVLGIALAGASAGRDLDINARGGALTSNAGLGAGGSIVLRGAGIAVNAAVTAGSDLNAFAGAGSLSLASAQAGGDLIVNGASIALGASSAGRDLLATASNGNFAGSSTLRAGRDLIASATGALTVAGDASATRNAYFDAASVSLAGLSAGQDGRASATTGDATIVSATVLRDLTVTAAAGLAQVGTARIGQDLLLTGARAALGSLAGYGSGYGYGYGYGTPQPRDATIRASAGGFVAPILGVSRDLTIDVAGILSMSAADAGRDVSLAGASINAVAPRAPITAGRDLTATARSGALTLGNVIAGDDVRLATSTTGIIGAVSATGTGTDTELDGRNIVVSGNALTLVSANASTDVRLDATGTLTVAGAVVAGQDAVLGAGTLALARVQAGRDLTLHARAGDFSATDLSAGRDLGVDASGSLTVRDTSAGRDVLLAAASIGGRNATATRDLTATARSGGLTLGNLSAGDDVRLATSAAGTFGAVSATGLGPDTEADGSNVVATGAALNFASVHATTDVRLDASGTLTVTGTVVAGQDAVLGAGTLALAGVQAGRDLSLASRLGSFGAADVSAVRDLTIDAAGTLSVRDATAGRDLRLVGASLIGRNASAGRDATLTARTGTLGFASVLAGDDARLSGTAIDIESVTTTGALDTEADGGNIVATGGSIVLPVANAFTDLIVTATGAAAIGVRSDGETGTESVVYQANAGRDIVMTGLSLLTGPLGAGRDLTLTVGAGGIQGRDSVVAARDLVATSDGGIQFLRIVEAGNDARIDGTTVAIPTLLSGNNARVSARTGDAQLGSASVARDLDVSAAQGLAQVFGANVGNDFRLSGAAVELGNLNGYTGSGGAFTPVRDLIIVATAGGLSGAPDIDVSRNVSITVSGAAEIGTAFAGNDIDVTAAAIGFGRLSSGRDLTLTAATISGGSALAGDDIRLGGGSILLDSVRARGTGPDSEADGSNVVITGSDVTLPYVTAVNDVRITGSGVLTIGIPADDSDAVFGADAGNDIVLNGASLLTGSLVAGRDVLLMASAGIEGRGDIFAGRDIGASAGTGLSFADLTAGDDIRLAAASGDAVFGTARTTGGSGSDSEGDGANIVATGRDVTLAGANARGDVILTATRALTSTGAIGASRDVRLSGGTLGLAGVSAGRDLALKATASGLDAGNVSAARDLTLDAAGALSFGSANAGRDVSLGGATITGGNVAATGSIVATARSGSLGIGNIASGSDATIVALTGNAVIGDARVSRDLTVTAALGLAQVGNAFVGQDFRLSGAQVALASLDGYTGSSGYGYGYGYGYGSFTRTRDAFIVATAGGLAGGANLTVARDVQITVTGAAALGRLQAGGDVLIAAGGTIDLGTANAGRDALLSGGGIAATGGITAGRDASLTSTAGISAAAIAAGDDLRLAANGPVTVSGRLDATGAGSDTEGDGSNVVVTGGIVATGDIQAAQDIALTGTSLATGALTAGRDLGLTTTASNLSVGNITAVRDLTLDASGALAVGTATAGRDATLTARGGSLSAGAVKAGDDARLTASGAITVDGPVDATGLGGDSESDGANVAISGGVAVTTGALGATRDVSVSGSSLSTGSLTSGRDLILTATSAGIATGNVTAARDLTLDASGALNVGTATAGRDVTLTARGGLLSAGAVKAGDDARLTASGAITIDGPVDATGLGGDSESDGANVAIAGGGAVTTGALGATRDVSVSGSSLSTGSLTSGRDLILTATSAGIATGNVTATRDLTLDASGALNVGTATAGRDATLTARGGLLSAGAVKAGDDARLTASGAVTVDGPVDATGLGGDSESDGANIAIAGGGAVTTGAVRAVNDVTISGSGLSTGALTAGRDLKLTTTSAGISAANIGAVRDLTIDANGALNIGTATAGRDATLISRNGALTATNVEAGDDARLTGASIAVGTVRAMGTGDSEADGGNVVLSGGSVTASQLAAVTDITVSGTGAVSVGQAVAGRDVLVSGGSIGGALQLSGRDLIVTSGGALVAGSGLVARRDIRLTAATTLSFAQLNAARDLTLTSAVVQGGNAVAARDLTVIATTRIGGNLYQAGRNLLLDPNEVIQAATVRATGNATLIGASIDVGLLEVGGTTLVQATAGGIALDTFTSGGAATLLATGTVALGASTTPALRIVAGDLDVRRSLVATTLQVETPGRMIVGGIASTGDTGFRLAAADIARVRVSGTASFYAGLTATITAPGGDLILQDFAYDPANLPSLAFYADRSHVVDVQGKILPSVTGGSIVIGDASLTGRFRPGSIYVSGGFGTAELIANCFGNIVAVGSLSLYSLNDVIFGASDFRSAIQATDAANIDLVGGTPAVPAGPGDNRLFAVATRFTVDAAGKIVSQNTASDAGAYVGLFFNGNGASGPIISVGNARAIDLAGSLVDASGNLRSGPTVAFAGELGSGGSNGAVFRFNGCIVGSLSCGSGSGGATPAEALRIEDYQPPRPIDILDEPLSTVLVVEQAPGDLEVLTIGTEADSIFIRKRKPKE